VRVEPLADRDLGDAALVVEHDAALGQLELERVARLAGAEQRAPGGPQVLQGLGRLAGVDAGLRIS
jgi:hypothetical protein